MGDITFNCPECSAQLAVDSAGAGRAVNCPSCSKRIQIPNAVEKSSADSPRTPSPIPAPVTKANTASTELSRHARVILGDLRQMNFKEEIVPIDGSNITSLAKDMVFWAATLLGVVPLLIGTLSDQSAQLTAFALFFAAIWAVIFKMFVLKHQEGWKLPLAAFFLTGIVGINVLMFAYLEVMPSFYMQMIKSESKVVQLLGFVLQVGICEELCKVAPVAAYMLWKRKQADPFMIVLVGVFSGLGFSAFENLNYGRGFVNYTYSLASEYGVEGLVEGVQTAMASIMLRSLSLVFCHALWSGILAYFLATAFVGGRRWGALIIVGLLVSATLHGAYDWFCGMQATLAALTAGLTFMLFYGYVSKLRKSIAAQAAPMPPVQIPTSA